MYQDSVITVHIMYCNESTKVQTLTAFTTIDITHCV